MNTEITIFVNIRLIFERIWKVCPFNSVNCVSIKFSIVSNDYCNERKIIKQYFNFITNFKHLNPLF